MNMQGKGSSKGLVTQPPQVVSQLGPLAMDQNLYWGMALLIDNTPHLTSSCMKKFYEILGGGFNPILKNESKLESSPKRDEKEKIFETTT